MADEWNTFYKPERDASDSTFPLKSGIIKRRNTTNESSRPRAGNAWNGSMLTGGASI